MKKFLYIFQVMLLCLPLAIFAQNCGPTQSKVVVEILTDNYGYETSWSVTSGTTTFLSGGTAPTYANNTIYRDSVCVPRNACTQFNIFDSFGDGICCAYGNGYFKVFVDGVMISTGGTFTNSQTVNFNCPSGSTCTSADTARVGGPYTASFDDHWYLFIPDTTGMYTISTCGINTCNTKIWVYSACGTVVNETNAGTIFYDDNSCGGLQAVITAALEVGVRYYIRIGDAQDNCTGNVYWNLQFNGPIRGCMDPNACNYNALATVSDTCIYPGSPSCPNGPDLVLREDILRSSMYVANYFNNSSCMVTENCIGGMGNRNLIRFTTHIDNNGNQDFYIGNPTTQPGQFNNNNCHGHWHYESYAEYLLYDANQTPLPIGFKSGFCVMDLVCQNGGTAQYGCGVMGITAGCGDYYSASLDCQWIDITNVPDGVYTFVVKVNWGNRPDALGNYEISYANNWGQVCFTLSRASGAPQITINPSCPTFVDCAGQPFGSAVPDCNGVCNGNAIRGNMNADTVLNSLDAQLYINQILNNSINATACNDLHSDTLLNVFDVALLTQCLRDSTKCNFPTGMVNIFDTAYLSIGNVNFTDNYVDIFIRNPGSKVLGYQFEMSGILIDSVVNLAPANYPVQPQWQANGTRVLALSMLDSTINRNNVAAPLCRVYFNGLTGNQICIQSVDGIISSIYQALKTGIEGPCVQPTPTSISNLLTNAFIVTLSPNPLQESTRFSFYNPEAEALQLDILDATGKTLRSFSNIIGNEYLFQREDLPAGMYFYRLSGSKGNSTGKLILK